MTPRLGGSTGEFATVAVAATAQLDHAGRFVRVSLAFAGVAERAVRARAAEALLIGAEPTADVLTAAARAASARSTRPPTSTPAPSTAATSSAC